MSAGTLSPGGSERRSDLPGRVDQADRHSEGAADAGLVLRSAWANAVGSCVLLVSVTSAAWFVSLPVFGADTFTRYGLTVMVGLYTLASAVLVLFAARGAAVNIGLIVVVTETVALSADRVAVVLGVIVAAIVMMIFVSRLDWALYAVGRWPGGGRS